MNIRELEAQAKALAPVLKSFVAKAVSAFKADLQKDLDARDKRLIDTVSESLEGIPTDAAEIARAAAALISPPKDGKDADPEEIQRAVAAEVGKLPVPQDGKSVTLDDLLPSIEELIASAVAELPVPSSGKDADPDDIRRMISEQIDKLPAPAAGKSVTLDDVLPAIMAKVEATVSELPIPSNGKDADPEHVRQLVIAEVDKIPVPADGKSVTIDDVLPLIENLVSAAVSQIPAPADGEDGKSFTLEEVQSLVDQAVNKAMALIKAPLDGAPGRNALDIEILPAIEVGKVYSRGAYAKHEGGLWRSFEQTQGLKGWECIVEGISSLALSQAGDRSIELGITLSSGAVESKSFCFPAMIYKGVFTPGNYDAGDTVTWAGSLWHCDDSTSDKPGEPGSKGWRLAVKRGRDGKDGINGKDLTAGVKIA